MYKIYYFFRLFCFWLFYFLINRCLFLIVYYREFVNVSYFEILNIFPFSLKLDISFISYVSVIIFLFLTINHFFSSIYLNRFISKTIFYMNSLFIILTAIIMGAEICLYKEWLTKLNFTAISHIVNPLEVLNTATYFHLFFMLFMLFVAYIFIRLYRVFVHVDFISKEICMRSFIYTIISIPFFLSLFLLLIRGGMQSIPVNLSDAYFSKHVIINDVAVNSNWNIVQSILKSKKTFHGNPYAKYSEKDVELFLNNFIKKNDSTVYVLNNKQPNLVFLLLESWSADNIESLKGISGITPNFKELESNGILFTEFFANGWTSDQGISSIFSSTPIFPYMTVINQSDKSRKLPVINKSLDNYHSSCFFGGQLTYGNIKGYLLSNGFDLVKDHNDYRHLESGRLGVHDEFMFDQFIYELRDLPQPFISTLFTLSSHSPFDFPSDHSLDISDKYNPYINSVAYTDKCLGDFMSKVKSEDWYNNTLFIIVADHSHNSPMEWRLAQKQRFKIPMLWYGDVLNEDFKGTKNIKLGSQIDISPTILAQLDKDYYEYKWGTNLFNLNNQSFVPYAFPKGYGLIKDKAYYAYSENYQKILEHYALDKQDSMSIKKQAELFFQTSFQTYLDLH